MNNTSVAPPHRKSPNQNIQVYARVRPINSRERGLRSLEVVDVISPREIVTRHSLESKLTKKFTFDRVFGPESRQVDVYSVVVAPLIEEVLAGYNCTVFAYGQTGTGKTHTMVGTECAELKSSWEDDSDIGIIPRALSHLFDELRLMEVDFSMRISYLELYNEELCDLLSTDDSIKIRIFDDSTKKGSVIIQNLEEIPVHSKDDVYKLLEKGKERRRTATTLMNAQSSRSHTVFSILVHIRENGIDGDEMLKIGKLNLVDLAGSENATKAGNEGIRVRETANINQSLLTLGRVITALVERTPHIPYRESKLTRLLQESLGGRTKTSIIATISPGHKDIEETLSTLQYADRAKNIQNKPEINQKLTKRTMLREYTEEIDKLKRDLMAARDKNGIYLAEETYNEITYKMDSQNRELNEKMLLIKAMKDEMQNKERLFSELSLNLVEKTTKLERTEKHLEETKGTLFETKKVLNTTKRRYKEKKTLLESHVKTEKILTDQAVKILEVADVATSETHQLHHAIERRSSVDQQIKRTCQQFTERMKNNFALLDGQLDELQNKQQTKVNMLSTKLANAHKLQNDLLNNSKAKVEELQTILKDCFIESSSLEKKYDDLIKTLNAEHRDELTQFLLEQKRIQLNQKETFEKALSELNANNAEQSLITKNLEETALGAFDQNLCELKNYTHELRKQLGECVMSVDKIIDVNLELQKQIDEESAAMEEERKFFEKIQENRLKRITQQRKFLEASTNNCENIKTTLSSSDDSTVAFWENQHAAKNTFTSLFKKGVNKILSLSEQFTTEYKKTEERSKLFHQENTQIIDVSINHNITKYNKIDETLCEKFSIATSVQEKHGHILENACSVINSEVSKHTQEASNELISAISFNTELRSHLNDYAVQYREKMDQCVTDVESLSQKEIRTYASTGATPSKKDFVYPRVLASTSPHNKIVKRLRQDNGWSDLDTTGTIDEEISIVEENEENPLINSIQEEPYSGVLLNSTPLNVILNNTKNVSGFVTPQKSARMDNGFGKENNPNLSENNPTLSENTPNLSENNPTLSENTPNLSENNPNLSKN